MLTDSSVEVEAPAPLVWEVFGDVERWPEWTASVTRLVAPDGPGLSVGKRLEIKQPRMPRLVWEVTEVAPGASWTWVQRPLADRPLPASRSSPGPTAAPSFVSRPTSAACSARWWAGSCSR